MDNSVVLVSLAPFQLVHLANHRSKSVFIRVGWIPTILGHPVLVKVGTFGTAGPTTAGTQIFGTVQAWMPASKSVPTPSIQITLELDCCFLLFRVGFAGGSCCDFGRLARTIIGQCTHSIILRHTFLASNQGGCEKSNVLWESLRLLRNEFMINKC